MDFLGLIVSVAEFDLVIVTANVFSTLSECCCYEGCELSVWTRTEGFGALLMPKSGWDSFLHEAWVKEHERSDTAIFCTYQWCKTLNATSHSPELHKWMPKTGCWCSRRFSDQEIRWNLQTLSSRSFRAVLIEVEYFYCSQLIALPETELHSWHHQSQCLYWERHYLRERAVVLANHSIQVSSA